jgi:hypothetical protein
MKRCLMILVFVAAPGCSKEDKSEFHVTATPMFAPADTSRAIDSTRARGDTVMLRDTVKP